uniref:Radial spoke head protein 9 homolog n=1 Tax=Palpitomonas bilix TaxID=652834 RepID=A0A7S3DFB3_9EUKA
MEGKGPFVCLNTVYYSFPARLLPSGPSLTSPCSPLPLAVPSHSCLILLLLFPPPLRCSADRVTWYDIPKVDEELKAKYAAYKDQLNKKGLSFEPLVGNEKDVQAEEEAEAEEGDEQKAAPVKLTDEEKLALIIDEINHHTGVVPAGAFILNSRHQIIPNPAFTGLSPEALSSLDNFYHLRKPNKDAHGSTATKFMDALSADEPKGCWAVTTDELTGSVSLRSLWYPGYSFTAKANSSEFSSFYTGSGQRNVDLPFML